MIFENFLFHKLMNNLDVYLDSENKGKFFEMFKAIFNGQRGIWVLYGNGNNGKTTLLNELSQFLEQFNILTRCIFLQDGHQLGLPPCLYDSSCKRIGTITIVETNVEKEKEQFPKEKAIYFYNSFK